MRRFSASRRLLALLLLAALLDIMVLGASSARAQSDAAPTVVVDAPGAGASVVAPVLLVGWAIGPESPSGTGVDAVAVYLDGPVGVGTPLGRALYGQARPDVARVRGDSRYASSGWALQAELPPGVRQLYVYAHLAERPDDQGWTEPLLLGLQVEGGPAVAGPVPREAPPSAAPARDPAPVTGISGGGACLDREQGNGRCLSFGGSNYTTCLIPDRESGRCLLRPTTSGGGGPAAGAIPGSWSLMSYGATLLAQLASGGDSSSTIAGGSMIGLSGPTAVGLGSLLGMPGGQSQLATTPGAAAGGAGPAAPRVGRAASSGMSVGGAGRSGGSSGPTGVTMGGGSTGFQPSAGAGTAATSDVSVIAARISLNASQVGGSQVLLSWNQPGLGMGVAYEIRRCSSFNSPTITCTVVATVQGSSYGVLQGEGVYLVRAIGPLGELQGESNRVQLCCRG